MWNPYTKKKRIDRSENNETAFVSNTRKADSSCVRNQNNRKHPAPFPFPNVGDQLKLPSAQVHHPGKSDLASEKFNPYAKKQ